MKRLFWLLTLLAFPVGYSAPAIDLITASIVVTNHPAGNASNIVIGASTRTWTNTISSSPGTLIRTTNSIQDSATNLWLHLATYPVDARHIYSMSATNTVVIYDYPDGGLAVTIGGNWGYVTYTTNLITETYVVRVPKAAEYATNQTNIASLVCDYLNVSTTAVSATSTAVSNLLNLTEVQVVPGQKVWTGTNFFANAFLTNAVVTNSPGYFTGGVFSNGIWHGGVLSNSTVVITGGTVSNVALRYTVISNCTYLGGVMTALTNGYWTNGFAENLTATNLNAIGSAANSVDLSGDALGAASIAIKGYASGDASLSIGYTSSATNIYDVAIGVASEAHGGNSIALGVGALAHYTNGIAIGWNSAASNSSVAIGASSANTKANQIMLGTSTSLVTTPGRIEDVILTNTIVKGTNVLDCAIYTPMFSVVTCEDNATNAVDLFTNMVLRLSGFASTQWGVGSILAAGVDGRRCTIINQTGFPMNIVNGWGGEGTAGYRILTGTGADVAITNNPGHANFIYDATSARWLLLDKSN